MTAAALACVLAVGACGHGSPTSRVASQRASQARDLGKKAGLPADVQDFLALYATGPERASSVTYAIAGPAGGSIRIDQQPPNRRVDVVTPPRNDVRSSFQLNGKAYACIGAGGGWSCAPDPSGNGQVGALAAADVQRTVDFLKSSRGTFTFAIERRTIVGVVAECLVTTPKRGAPAGTRPTSLCIASTGTPLLIEGGGEPLTATAFSSHVDPARLKLPAAPRK
jgi:hypothetical protein